MDLEELALAVDDRIHSPAAERGDGRLYAVRTRPVPTNGAAAATNGAAEFELELLAKGEARKLPQKVRPPAGVDAIVLSSGVWVAPLDDRLVGISPSRHPSRRRGHVTTLIACEGDCQAVDVTVLRYGDGLPTVMRGGVGELHQRLVRCWSRRPEARWASTGGGTSGR